MKFITPFFAAFALIVFLSLGSSVSAHCGSCGVGEEKHSQADTVKKAECPNCEEGKPCEVCAAKMAKKAKKSAKMDCATCKDGKPCAKCAAGKSMKKVAAAGVGAAVASFSLSDSAGKQYSLSDYGKKVKVVVFYNQNCPYVVESYKRMDEFAKSYADKGVAFLAIDAGTNNSVEDIATHQKSVSFPVLVNENSNLAKKFGASRTPEVYVLDKDNKLVYTGMFDSGQDVDADGNRKTPAKDAVDAVLAGEDVEVTKTKAFGCGIKFKKK